MNLPRPVVARRLAGRDIVEDAAAWVADPAPVARGWAVGIAIGLLHGVTDESVAELLVEAAFPGGATGGELREIADMAAAFDFALTGRLTGIAPIVHAPISDWKPSPFTAGKMYAVRHRVLHPGQLTPGRLSLQDVLNTDDGGPAHPVRGAAEPVEPDPDGGVRWRLTAGPGEGREFVVWHEPDERLGFPWTFVHAIPPAGCDYGEPIIDAPLLRGPNAVRAALLVVDGQLDPPDLRRRPDVLPGWN